MPAIQPARLKLQAAGLVENFYQPAAFVRSLHALLELYAERTHRPAEMLLVRRLISSYHVPAPVNRHILNELRPLVEAHPQAALALCDSLWQEEWWEFRCLAAQALGMLEPDCTVEIMARLQAWLMPGLEQDLLHFVTLHATNKLCEKAPQALLEQVAIWLEERNFFLRQAGLRIIGLLTAKETFHNLPLVFKLLQPFLRIAPKELRPDVIHLLKVCIHRSEIETAHLLQQNLEQSGASDASWLARQVLTEFSPPLRKNLQMLLRDTH